jgi:hypothetical protein
MSQSKKPSYVALVAVLVASASIYGTSSAEEDCTALACSEPVCSSDSPNECDAKATPKPNPCASSHKGVFYDNDFSYLNDPSYQGCCLGDCLKLMPVAGGEWGTFDVGGQPRLRYHHEQGMGQDISGPGVNRFEFTNHDFVLERLRLYGNWQLADGLRFYVEGIFAYVSDDQGTYAPRPIDRNYGDFLNLFVDVSLSDSLTARVGRQELLYGAQRLVSPLDWANTRRTFDGARLLYKSDEWKSDVFYTYVVPVVFNELDESDYKQAFYGNYNTITLSDDWSLDAYYLGYDNRNLGAGQDFSIHTLGLRLTGALDEHWLVEMEGGPQFGRQSGLGLNQSAGFWTCGIGRKLNDALPWSPTLWCYYDYASGNSGGGDFNQFNDLFPLGHKYLGFIDAVRRQNIEAPNVLLTMKPHAKVDLLCWYWHFMADQAESIVPSFGGTPTQNTTSKDFGDELDLIAKYGIGPRSNVLIGYSHFWRGNKITAPADADFTYVQWELDF